MQPFGRVRGFTFSAGSAVTFTGILLAGVLVLQQAIAQPTALLLVYEGSASVASAAGHVSPASSGREVKAGEAVATGATTKASLTYPNLAQARLDSNTSLRLESIVQAPSGGLKVAAFQSIGKTWHSLHGLLGGASYVIRAPNTTTAEVRGTEFEVIVEIVDGVTIVRINVFSGQVAVTAHGITVILYAGDSTTILPDAPPTAAAPISTADRQDSFTVFNQTLDASAGTPVSFNDGHFSPPESSGLVDGPLGDGNSDLQFTLGWPGSTFSLSVYAPDGSLLQTQTSSAPPFSIISYRAAVGRWRYRVTDIQSHAQEAWWVIVTRITPSRLNTGQVAPTPGATTSPGASPTPTPPVTTTSLRTVATPSPSARPSPGESPKPSSTPSSTPSPAPGPGSQPNQPPAPSPSPSPAPAPSGSPSPSPAPSPSPTPSPSPAPSPSPGPTPPPPGTPGVSVRGDGYIAAGPGQHAVCSSPTGSAVRFKLRATATGDGPQSGNVVLDFSTGSPCAPGKQGARAYELTSTALTGVESAAQGGPATLTFASLVLVDDTSPSKPAVILCPRWSLRVVVVPGAQPGAGSLRFTIVDGDGKTIWSTGVQPMVRGSLGV